MELKRIPFCDKNQLNICSHPFKKHILGELEETYHVKTNDRSTRLYQPSRHHEIISQKPYYISTKSIGNTYLLYLTQIQGVNLSFLIDKKVLKGYTYPRIIMVRYRFGDEIYHNTLLEGDLIKTEKGWKYLISDLLVLQGNDIRNKSLPKRLNALHHILNQSYQPDPTIEPCSLLVKTYFPFNSEGYQRWKIYQEQLYYKVQGMTLTSATNYKPSLLVLLVQREPRCVVNPEPGQELPEVPKLRSKLSTHFLNETYENQTESEEMFTFQITQIDTSGIYQLWCKKLGKIVKHSIARVDGLICLQFLKKHCHGLGGKYWVKCAYNFDFRKFIPRQISTESELSEYTDIIVFTKEKMMEIPNDT